jgi:hypothetical protein
VSPSRPTTLFMPRRRLLARPLQAMGRDGGGHLHPQGAAMKEGCDDRGGAWWQRWGARAASGPSE